MTALTPCKSGVAGILLFFIGAAVTCAQTFTLEFDVPRSDIYEDFLLTDAVGNWQSDNALDGKDVSGIETGSLFFQFPGETDVVALTLDASSVLNWTASGLGDGGTGLNQSGEYVSFSFNRAVTVDLFDFAGFTPGGSDAAEIRKPGIEDPIASYSPDGSSNDDKWDSGLSFAAGEEFRLAWAGGSFFLETMTISVVPETPTLLLGGLAAGIAVCGLRRRKRES